MRKRHWMICDQIGRGTDKPCLFNEESALKRGDPPRCIRHGALLFSDTTLNGASQDEARRIIKKRHED